MKVKAHRGFTMVEMLTVIAIIAILAAIIFPVFSTVRKNVYKSQCTANLHSLAIAIKLYKDDYRIYPDALYGYLSPDGTVGRTFLYPQYIKDRSGFRCPVNPEHTTNVTSDLLVKATDVLQPANSPYSHQGLLYYKWDSYDGSFIPHTDINSNTPYVVHYMRKVTAVDANANDNPRQLIYRNPPDNTVVTWCTHHRTYEQVKDPTSGLIKWVPQAGVLDLVLFLDGRVKPIPANRTQEEGMAHAVTPNS